MRKSTFSYAGMFIAVLCLSFNLSEANNRDVGMYNGINNDSVPHASVNTVQCWEPFSFYYYGRNYGSDTITTPFTVRFVFSKDTIYQAGTDIFWADQSISGGVIPLKPKYFFGGNINGTAPAATDVTPGDWYILIVIDYGNVLTETNENNNVGHTQKITITCTTKPDLFIDYTTGYAPTYTPTTVNSPSDPIAINYWVGNSGDGFAPIIDVKFYLSTNNVYNEGVDVLITTQHSDSAFIPYMYRENDTIIRIPGNTPNGTYYIIMIVDKDNLVDEWDETNNKSTPQLITVQGFTGIADNLSGADKVNLFPNPAKDHVNISFEKTVNGKANISIVNLMGEIVLSQSDVDVLNNGTRINLPSLSKGTYFISIRTNDELITKRLIIIE